MGEARFTPGPWHVIDMPHDNRTWITGGEGGDYGLIALVTERDDAPVIAAAPSLYETLERARQSFINLLDLELLPERYRPGVDEELDRINAALRLARGEEDA